MELLHILTEYLFRTAPLMVFPGPLLLPLRLTLQLPAPLYRMAQTVRKRAGWERAVLFAFPAVLAILGVFADLTLGSSFLTGGFQEQAELLTELQNPAAQREFLLLILLFPPLFLLTRLRLPHTRTAVLLDLFPLLGWLTACAGTADLLLHGSLTVWGILPQTDAVTCYTYSLFSLALQVFFHIMALLWRLLLGERTLRDPDALCQNPTWCRRQTARMLTEPYRVILLGLAPLILLLDDIFLGSAGFLVLILLFLLVPHFALLFCLLITLFPQLHPAFRRMNKWQQADVLFCRFGRMFLHPDAHPLRGVNLTSAGDFLVQHQGLRSSVFYGPFYSDTIQDPKRGTILLFSDGARLPLPPVPGDRTMVHSLLSLNSNRAPGTLFQ